MGYSHSWDRYPTEQDPQLFADFAIDLYTMLATLRFVQDTVDMSASQFGPTEIRIVPAAYNASESFVWPALLDYNSDLAQGVWEPMRQAGILEPGWGWFACKTSLTPFDVIVCAALIRAKHIYRDQVSVSSDGEWDTEWNIEHPPIGSAKNLCLTVFGIADNPLNT